MGAAEKLIDMAKSQIGYLEKSRATYEADPSVLDDFKRGAGMDNITKYARDQWKVKYFNSSKQGVAWCAVFVGWCFLQCFGKDVALRLQCQPRSGNAGAGCGPAARYYQERGRFRERPEAGDQIFFSNGSEVSHTGIVEKVEGEKVYTIEGNSDGMVTTHKYRLDSERIYGYGHPDWSIAGDGGEEKKEDKGEGKVQETVIIQGGNISKPIRMRQAASTGSPIIAEIPQGSQAGLLEGGGTWNRVSWEGKTGYVKSEYVVTGGGDEGEDTQPGEMITISRAEIEAARNLLDGWLRGTVG